MWKEKAQQRKKNNVLSQQKFVTTICPMTYRLYGSEMCAIVMFKRMGNNTEKKLWINNIDY